MEQPPGAGRGINDLTPATDRDGLWPGFHVASRPALEVSALYNKSGGKISTGDLLATPALIPMLGIVLLIVGVRKWLRRR